MRDHGPHAGRNAPPRPFTPLDFQLVLLRRMADHNPDLVEEARHALGVSIADMREANRRWQAMLVRPGLAVRRLPLPLRPRRPRVRRGPAGSATWTCEALLWPVPLWPDLRFEVAPGPERRRLERMAGHGPGAPAPEPGAPSTTSPPGPARSDEAARAFAPGPAPGATRPRPAGG